jgi:hypothetical protein
MRGDGSAGISAQRVSQHAVQGGVGGQQQHRQASSGSSGGGSSGGEQEFSEGEEGRERGGENREH